jgi:hypothetical protein
MNYNLGCWCGKPRRPLLSYSLHRPQQIHLQLRRGQPADGTYLRPVLRIRIPIGSQDPDLEKGKVVIFHVVISWMEGLQGALGSKKSCMEARKKI